MNEEYNTNLKTIIEKAEKYAKQNGFKKVDSPGLIQPQFQFEFSASAGHHVADPILFSKEPEQLYKFYVIPDRVIRMYDLEKIGVSNRHISFFENILTGYVGAKELIPREEACKNLFDFCLALGLEKERLIVTVLKEANIEGIHIDEDAEEIKLYSSAWKKILGEEKVKKTRGRRNVFYSRIKGNPGGIGCELYYKIKDNWVEIGSQVNYKFRFMGGLERTRNEAILQGFGLERLLMAIEEKSRITDVSTILPIKESVKDCLRALGEDELTINLYDETLGKIADSIRAISFIIYDCKGDVANLSKSQRKVLYNFKKVLNSQIDYLGIKDNALYNGLIRTNIDLYKDRYPNLLNYEKRILDFIKTSREFSVR